MLSRAKPLISIFILLLTSLLCTSCATNTESNTVTPSSINVDNSYVCKEIKAPFENISDYLSYNTVYNPDAYTVITGTQDAQTMKNTYQKLEYINNEWKNTTFTIDDKNTMVFGFYRSDNGKLYGESTVSETKVIVNDNAGANTTSSPKKGESHRNIYEINEKDNSTKIYTVKKWKGVDDFDNLMWQGVKEDKYAIFYEMEKENLYSYDFREQKTVEHWEDISAKSLCVSGKEIYVLDSTDVAQIIILKSGAKEAEKITFPKIRNAVSLDILDEELFLLTTDGIYIGNSSSANSFTKIFDGTGITIDWEYLSDFSVTRDGNDYKFYLSSSSESGEITVNEIKRGNSR